IYKGVWPRERLPDLYRQVHGFVFPTLLDSFGLVLLEAMACGLPVIATTHSGGPDLIAEGQEGYLVPPFSVEALMEAIERLYQLKPEERAAMGAAARKKVETNWTLAHYEKRVATYLAQHVSGV
ncbi:MAG: glycosyltransferase, partial [Bacteroidetes bacterium]